MPSDPIAPEVGCSTISFRFLPLPRALSEIAGQGFAEIDLGALPGVCDHVPTPLPADAVDVIATQVGASGLRCAPSTPTSVRWTTRASTPPS